MGKQYTIGQLARAAEVPTSTLRYYERIGLLKPEDRSQGNYRLYTDESLRRVEFICAAQGIGFTLVDVKTLLGRANGTPPCCGDVQTLVRKRLADIEKRLTDLRHVRNVLKSTLQKCQESEELGLCYVVDKLRRKTDK